MRPVFALMALVALSGCISFGEEPPPFLMSLSPGEQIAVGANRSAATGQAITIRRPDIPQKLITNRVPVQVSDTSIAYLQNALWVDSPNELFRALLAEVVAARTGRVVLDPAQYSEDPGLIVSGQLQEFGLDARTSEVVVVYDAAIRNEDGIRTRRFEARETVAVQEAQFVGQALNRAANRIAVEVSDWVTG